HAVAERLGELWLRAPVALHLQHLEADHDAVAVAVAVAGGEVAVDAAADALALGAHVDALGHLQAAVGLDPDLDVVAGDALLRRHRHGPGQQPAGARGEDGQACRVHGSSTRTAARCCAPASKKSSAPNPASRATTRSGTRWVASL